MNLSTWFQCTVHNSATCKINWFICNLNNSLNAVLNRRGISWPIRIICYIHYIYEPIRWHIGKTEIDCQKRHLMAETIQQYENIEYWKIGQNLIQKEKISTTLMYFWINFKNATISTKNKLVAIVNAADIISSRKGIIIIDTIFRIILFK